MSCPFRKPWAALTAALAVHVWDEWRTDFLALYNPAVDEIRQAVPAIHLPTFTYDAWLTLLASAVVVLAALTPLAGPGAWGLVLFGRLYAGLMILNGAGHLAASAGAGEWLSGSASAPFLIAAAVWLWRAMPAVGDARTDYQSRSARRSGSRDARRAR